MAKLVPVIYSHLHKPLSQIISRYIAVGNDYSARFMPVALSVTTALS